MFAIYYVLLFYDRSFREKREGHPIQETIPLFFPIIVFNISSNVNLTSETLDAFKEKQVCLPEDRSM